MSEDQEALEFRTARVQMMGGESHGVRVTPDKFGVIKEITLLAVVVFKTTMVSSGTNPGGNPGGPEREARFQISDSPFYFSGNNFGIYNKDPSAAIVTRLTAEAKAVFASLAPYVEKARKRHEERIRKRMTGAGADERITKMKDRLAEALKSVQGDINPLTLLRIISLHAIFGCFQQNSAGSFNLVVTDGLLKELKTFEPYMTSLMDILALAERWSSPSNKKEVYAMKNFLQTARGNPTHVALLKEEHVAEAIDLASVNSIMER